MEWVWVKVMLNTSKLAKKNNLDGHEILKCLESCYLFKIKK